MQFSKLSKEAVCEILTYLAENESFASLSALQGVTRPEVRDMLREIAEGLKTEMVEEIPAKKPNYSEYDLSPSALSLISCLSPREEILLFKSFKLL